MGKQFLPTVFRLSEADIHLYGLLAQASPPATPAPPTGRSRSSRSASQATSGAHAGNSAIQAASSAAGSSAADQLRGTPTLVVSNKVLDEFGAADFPLLAVTDHRGILRFLQVAPENAFVAGGLVDQVTARIALEWPVQPSPPATP